MREKVERSTAARAQWGHRQHGALDRSRARHFLSMRAPLGDFLRQAAKRVREVGEFRQRCSQVVKQAQVEIVLAERLQRIGVESNRMIERLKSAPNLLPRQEIAGSRCRTFASRRCRYAERVAALSPRWSRYAGPP